MAPPRRRISYIIPPPSEPIPRLQLPPREATRNGTPGPLLVPITHTTDIVEDIPAKWAQYPRHRLGVACLALDTSTQLVGRATPEGMLYSGGRDGLIISWDLNITMKKRAQRYGITDSFLHRWGGRWEIMTGWADDIPEEEGEGEEESRSDGDILGDVHEAGGWRIRGRRSKIDRTIPFEEQWETDLDVFQHGRMSQFRQCVQAHPDWVNDLLLCNYNQTVISASSDGTVKAWSPHATSPVEPTLVGMHADYVRCLSLCREQRWVASGSFDRTVKLWDVSREGRDPLVTLHSPEASGPKASVYALATDPYGSVVASGSPERVVRMWDPRSGKRTGKLVGHTDNIRAILISEDARYLLTGSADASIKLWSLATQRCLHTFTHHTESVWSLFSSHPSLEIFYSGDRSGIVCKVDVEACSDVSEGECIVICQDAESGSMATEGVNKIVAMDDNLLWTATGSSSIKRWCVPARRATRAAQLGLGSGNHTEEQSPAGDESLDWPGNRPRTHSPYTFARQRSEPQSQSPSPPSTSDGPGTSMTVSVTDPSGTTINQDIKREGEETWYGIPFESLVKLTSPETFSAFGGISRGRDPEIATLYSAASVMSVPRLLRSPLQSVFQISVAPSSYSHPQRNVSPMPSDTMQFKSGPEETLHPLRTARVDYEERDVAPDAVPLHSTPDEVIHGDHGLVRSAVLNDRMHALTVNTAGEVAVWDIVRGICVGRFVSEDITNASFRGSTNGSSGGEPDTERSPREALETVRERIEGEAVVASWANVDTKTGLLTVHLNERCFEAEIYADEAGYNPDRHFGDEMRINIGKWVLRNLFIQFIRELQRSHPRRTRETTIPEHHRIHRAPAPTHIDLEASERRPRSSSDSSRKSAGTKSATIVVSAHMLPTVSPSILSTPPRATPLAAPLISLSSTARETPLSPIPQSPFSNETTPIPIGAPRRSATIDHGAPASRENDYFSLRSRRPSVSHAKSLVPPSPDDFSSWGTSGSTPKSSEQHIPQTPSTPGTGGLMGRLRAFGKSGKRQATDFASGTPDTQPVTDTITTPSDNVSHSSPKTPLQLLLQGPLSFPSSSEVPSLPIPTNTSILISEETRSGWSTLYQGQVSSTGYDLSALEEAMPMWLLEYLITNRVPPIPMVKISFVLLPYPSRGSHDEQLPELLNTAQSKLTASRFLRVRKLTHHVQDKLDKLAASTSRIHSTSNTPRSSLDTRSMSSASKTRDGELRPRPEDEFEILCHDVILPLDMTLAAVRQFVWRQSHELTMFYRRKLVSAPAAANNAKSH